MTYQEKSAEVSGLASREQMNTYFVLLNKLQNSDDEPLRNQIR
jgi:hypothetical protein